jgi:hypothetical protein
MKEIKSKTYKMNQVTDAASKETAAASRVLSVDKVELVNEVLLPSFLSFSFRLSLLISP